MASRRKSDDIPIKIGGWDGKFVFEKPKLKQGYELVKPTRGALERDQWQEGKKEVIHKARDDNNHSSNAHSQETTSKTTTSKTTSTSTQSKEHYTRVQSHEEEQQNERCDQHQSCYDDEFVENRQSQTTQNQSNYDAYQQQQQQQYHQQQQQQQHYAPRSTEQYQNEYEYNQTKQQTSDAGHIHGHNTETEVLPAQWDGKYPESYRNYRPNPQINQSNANNLHGYTTEPTVLPAQWDGKYPDGYRNYRPKPDQNRSSANNMYGFCTEPTVLPVQWDGKFAKSGETYMVPDRNRSKTNDLYGYDTTPTVLPTTWNGQFQLDPNDVRIKPERNASDVRDYADHRRFVTRE